MRTAKIGPDLRLQSAKLQKTIAPSFSFVLFRRQLQLECWAELTDNRT